MAKDQIFLTKEGLKKLQGEYEHLATIKRKEIAERIRTAREMGDVSENAEYNAAREEQGFVEGRIAELEEILGGAEVADEEKTDGAVKVGSRVGVVIDGEEDTYTIVGSVEAAPEYNKISYESPVGKALLGKKVGDEVEVKLPDATLCYKVREVK